MDDDTRVARKRKRNAERARVTRACDRCKKRKIKCNGIQPCEFCTRAKAECLYETTYARGKAPPIISAPEPSLEAALEPSVLNTITEMSPPEPMARFGDNQDLQLPGRIPAASPSGAASSHKSPRSSKAGLHGHYIGPASGVSFLQRVQKRLDQAISFSHPDSIFTFGDAPFVQPDADPSFCMMLPREEAQRLVDRYFDFAMPTYRFLHRPTIQALFAEFYDTFGIMHDTQTAPAKVALLLMVFAHGRVYLPDGTKPGPPDLSNRLFLAAEQQLVKESGSIRLTSIQARLSQCYYLLTQSRINHCWGLFGTVTHLALASGLNRSRKPDSITGLSQIEAECRRRTLWCAFTLDVYLSVVLGRPQLLHVEDIDTELPTSIEDEELQESHFDACASASGHSTMLAPLAHISLARVVSTILRKLYPLKPISNSRRIEAITEVSKQLTDWREDLTPFLDSDSFSASLLRPIFQRQRNVLNLTYWHALILTHRPLLLNNFTGSRRNSTNPAEEDRRAADLQDSVQKCLDAAMKTVSTINQMTQTRQMSRAFWIAAYFAFSAAVVLYIYVIQHRTSPADTYNEYLIAATLCQSHISSIAEKGSLPERYCLLLEELRLECMRQSGMRRPVITPISGDATYSQDFMNMGEHGAMQNHFSDTLGDQQIDYRSVLDPNYADYAGWDQFASMISSGLGNLDGFLYDDSFRI